MKWIVDWLIALGVGTDSARGYGVAIGVLLLIAVAWLANVVTKTIILRIVSAFVRHTRFTWDDALLKTGVFTRLSHVAPAMAINYFGPDLLGGSPEVLRAVEAAVNIYLTLIWLGVFFAILDAAMHFAQSFKVTENMPVKGFTQAVKLVATLVAFILILSILFNKSPIYLLTGMGALTAILLLVFRDAILGFVAGIMISVNEMVRIGDWIEMPKAGADGEVIDVSLTTVKVQNWDRTITAIPSYDLIANSFKNWRGMFESGGRRIKRALLIDMRSVHFADAAMIEHWRKIDLLKPYLVKKQAEVDQYNLSSDTDLTILGNGRRITNLGTFRAYCVAYLRSHPLIHQDMTFLVRQLAPTENGLPLEIYVFTADTRWAVYEDIQADVFDHLLAVIGEFGLQVYQHPSGDDVRSALERLDRPHDKANGTMAPRPAERFEPAQPVR